MMKIRILFFSALFLLAACEGTEEPEFFAPAEITSLTVNGKEAELDKKDFSLVATLPTTTDFSSVILSFTIVGEGVFLNGEEVFRDQTRVDATHPLTLVVKNGRSENSYTLTVRNTGLPVVRIKTPGGREITSKTDWMADASMRIENPDGSLDYEGTMSIRGRGNSTWNYPKKPYALKLDSKSQILGMPKHKRWILLANWKDRTLLRNDAAFWLSRHTGLAYTVRGQFVEVEFNGKHVGNYYLCEQIKIDKNRVNIEEMEAGETDPELITGGYLLELDTYYDEINKFRSSRFLLPYQFKEPDEDALSPAAFNYVKNYVTELERILKDPEQVKAHAYEPYLDVDSAIWFMFVNELATNTDFFSSWPFEGPHSVYFYKPRGDKLYSGPVWDFDYHGFVPTYAKQWAGADKTLYYPALWGDEKFRARMLELWEKNKDTFRELTDYIDQMAEKIRISEEINHQLWPIPAWQNENGDEQMDFSAAVERIKKGFTDKWTWMDAHLTDLK